MLAVWNNATNSVWGRCYIREASGVEDKAVPIVGICVWVMLSDDFDVAVLQTFHYN